MARRWRGIGRGGKEEEMDEKEVGRCGTFVWTYQHEWYGH